MRPRSSQLATTSRRHTSTRRSSQRSQLLATGRFIRCLRCHTSTIGREAARCRDRWYLSRMWETQITACVLDYFRVCFATCSEYKTVIWELSAWTPHLQGCGLNCAHISHCFARVYATTPHLSSAKACTITMESDTSPHVLRFTGFDHRRERRRLE